MAKTVRKGEKEGLLFIVMGVSGSGKTTIAQLLAQRLAVPYYDADDFHPKANLEKMSAGFALNDKDRLPWLNQLAENLQEWNKEGGAVLACSALKETYRQLLSANTGVQWVYLSGTYDLIKTRMEERNSHFMKADLLQSQFDTLEIPDYGIHIDIAEKPSTMIDEIIRNMNRKNAFFGVIGLGVMGKSLSLNIADKGYSIAVYNRSEGDEAEVVSNFLAANKDLEKLEGYTQLPKFVESLEQPRKILLMIKAGKVVDAVLEQLVPLLAADDVVIDGGNSHYQDTQRRFENLQKQGIHFIGAGISGGEEGARNGPSIMPGGTQESYAIVAPVLEDVSAKDDQGNACCAYIGKGGSGHFIKMVHNGIEYAEMQLLAECYALLSPHMNYDKISQLFLDWNAGELSSYLLGITATILQKKEGEDYLLDKILDKAGNKGTGSWSSKAALELGQPNTMMASAVFARYVSAFKAQRIALSKAIEVNKKPSQIIDLEELKQAYQFARIINHHQGFELMQAASEAYDWGLNLSEIARIWTNGCIIKSNFMQTAISLLESKNNLLEQTSIRTELTAKEAAIAHVLQQGIQHRIPLVSLSAAYNYWISMTTERLSANLIQAQRDFFGAHTYQRVDAPLEESFHTLWSEKNSAS